MVDDNNTREGGERAHWPLSRRRFMALGGGAVAATQFAGQSVGGSGEAGSPTSVSYDVEGLNDSAEILVDRYGVPHMYAESLEDVSFVQGFNAARDRLWQIDLWRRRALGELSEVLGDEYVDHDRAARLFTYRGSMDEEWEAYGQDSERIASGFARGINQFIELTEENPELLPVEFEALDYDPIRWEPEDVVRMRIHAISLNVSNEVERATTIREFGTDVEAVRERLEPEREIEIPEGLDLDVVPEDVLEVYEMATMSHLEVSIDEDDVRNPEVLEDLSVVEGGSDTAVSNEYGGADPQEADAGSNNWVLSPDLTTTGRPIVANDPHRTHGVPSLRYIEHINSPEVDAIGAGEPGLPGISIGHNGHVAFGLTIFYIDQEDLYVYETNPDDPNEYRYEDGWEAMEVERETIGVREGDDREVELKFTRHGPVIYEDPDENVAFAVRTVWTEPGTTAYFGSVDYMRAETVEEFGTAMERWGAPPENQVVADTDGNVGWFPGGLTPIRPNWDGLLPVPGDGRYEWDGFLDQVELPSEVNPERGWIATANQENLPEDYPPDDPPIGFDGWIPPFRYDRIEEVLSEVSEESPHSLEDSTDLQTDELSIPARRITALLEGLEADDDLAETIEMLVEWDDVLDADSGPAALFQVWFRSLQEAVTIELVGEEAYEHIGSGDVLVIMEALEEPEEWFEGVAVRDELLLETLEDAVDETEELLGEDRDEWEWGDLHVAHFEHQLSDAVGEEVAETLDVGPRGIGGSENTVNAQWVGEEFSLTGGASWRMVVDVGEWDNSLAVNTPGQSGDPESPHYDDLFDDWADGEYFPLLYSRAAIEGACVRRIELDPREEGE